MKQIHIIQFMPYFPPHKGGVESVGKEIGKYWIGNNLGNVTHVISDFEQEIFLEDETIEKLIYESIIIGYKKEGTEVLVVPSFEAINNFPIYKIWSKKYKLIQRYLKSKITRESSKNYRVITHTRFFFTSLLGGIFARRNNIKWIHIEHGSSYVLLSSKLKSYISIIYDRIFGKWIFKKSDVVLAISEACKTFIQDTFIQREVEVFYRGIDFPGTVKISESLTEKFQGKKILGYVGRLYKWKNVESFIQAYYNLDTRYKEKLQLVIVGDGEDLNRLKKLDTDNLIYFTGGKSFLEALVLQKQFDIHMHPSSPGGGLATTLLQAMYLECYIIATPNEGAKEVIVNNKNGILLKDDSIGEIQRGIILALEHYDKKEEYAIENKKIIEDDFSWKGNIEKLYNLVK